MILTKSTFSSTQSLTVPCLPASQYSLQSFPKEIATDERQAHFLLRHVIAPWGTSPLWIHVIDVYPFEYISPNIAFNMVLQFLYDDHNNGYINVFVLANKVEMLEIVCAYPARWNAFDILAQNEAQECVLNRSTKLCQHTAVAKTVNLIALISHDLDRAKGNTRENVARSVCLFDTETKFVSASH